jgi:hypothetical protein
MYSLTIEVPQFLNLDKPPRVIVARFKEKEEWEAYKVLEWKHTRDAIKKTRCAMSHNEVVTAYRALYAARKAFYQHYFNKETSPKDLA